MAGTRAGSFAYKKWRKIRLKKHRNVARKNSWKVDGRRRDFSILDGQVYVALQYAANFHCLIEQWKDCGELKPKPIEKWILLTRGVEGMKHRTEWCAADANMYRCIRCGRGSKYMKMPGKCTGPQFLSKSLDKW